MEINEPTDIEWHFNVKRPDYLLNQSLVAASDLGCLKKKTGFGNITQIFGSHKFSKGAHCCLFFNLFSFQCNQTF